MEEQKNIIKNTRFSVKKSALQFEIMLLEDFLQKNLNRIIGKVERVHFFLVIFITKGSGKKHFIDFKEYEFKAGEMLFIAPNQIQQFSPDIADCEGYLMVFTEHFFAKNPIDLDFLYNCAIFDITMTNSVLTLSEELFDALKVGMEVIMAEFKTEKDWATEEVLKRHLSLLLFMAERVKRRSQPQITENVYLNDFYKLKKLLDINLKQHHDVEFYADLLNISTKKLNRITQSILKKSAKEFIDNRIILEAKRLILHSKLSVKEVCYELNFDEPTNFIKFFKKHTGVTPVNFKAE